MDGIKLECVNCTEENDVSLSEDFRWETQLSESVNRANIVIKCGYSNRSEERVT